MKKKSRSTFSSKQDQDQPQESELKDEDDEAKINASLSFKGIKMNLRFVGWELFNLGAVYFLEYMCTTSFSERANPKPDPGTEQDFWHKNAFVLLALCYQIGVFLSRSSFSFFQFRRVGILTFLQTINWIVYATVAYYKWMSIYWQLPLMIWVGCMGGCSYVNCMYLILASKKIDKKNKEVSLNVTGLASEVGIIGATICSLIVSNYIIKN